MLVYERSSGKPKSEGNQGATSSHVSERIAPSGRLAEKITQINREYDALCDDFEMRFVELHLRHSVNTELDVLV